MVMVFFHPRGGFTQLRAAALCRGILTGLLFFAILGQAPLGLCDVVSLRSGKRIEAEIVSQTSHAVFLRTHLGVLRIDRSEIQSLEKTPPQENASLFQFQVALGNGSIAEALQHLSAMNAPRRGEEKLIDELLLRHRGAILKAAPQLLGPAPNAVGRYLALRSSPPEPEILGLAVELGIATGDTTGVEELIDRYQEFGWLNARHCDAVTQVLSQACTRGSPEDGRWLRLLLRLIEERQREERNLAPEEISTLVRALQQTVETWPDLATSATKTLLLHAPVEVRPAIALFAIRYIEDNHSTLSLLSLLTAIEDLSEQIELPRNILETVARKHVALLLSAHSFVEARKLIRRIERGDADLAATLLLQVELQEQLNALSPENAWGRYRLAKWARRNGLRDEAESIYRTLLGSDQISEAALAQVELIQLEKDAERLRQAIASYQQRDFTSAEEQLRNFLKTRPRSQLTSEAAFLKSLAEHMRRISPLQRRTQCFGLLQAAERLAMQNRFAAARDYMQQARLLCPDLAKEIADLIQRFPPLRFSIVSPSPSPSRR